MTERKRRGRGGGTNQPHCQTAEWTLHEVCGWGWGEVLKGGLLKSSRCVLARKGLYNQHGGGYRLPDRWDGGWLVVSHRKRIGK